MWEVFIRVQLFDQLLSCTMIVIPLLSSLIFLGTVTSRYVPEHWPQGWERPCGIVGPCFPDDPPPRRLQEGEGCENTDLKCAAGLVCQEDWRHWSVPFVRCSTSEELDESSEEEELEKSDSRKRRQRQATNEGTHQDIPNYTDWLKREIEELKKKMATSGSRRITIKAFDPERPHHGGGCPWTPPPKRCLKGLVGK